MNTTLLEARPGPGCFWHEYRELWGHPNVQWCEQQVCSIIEQPATTWSNLAIIFVGLWILKKEKTNKLMRYFGWSVFFMGAFSFIYHASNNWPTQILDFIGMYLYTGVIITLNFLRLGKITAEKFKPTFALVFIANMLLIPFFHQVLHIHIQLIVLVNVLVMIAQEILIRKKDKTYSLKYFAYTLGFVALAQSFSMMDGTRFYCEPTNKILHGHALWHALGAVSEYFSYLFYRQFKDKLKS